MRSALIVQAPYLGNCRLTVYVNFRAVVPMLGNKKTIRGSLDRLHCLWQKLSMPTPLPSMEELHVCLSSLAQAVVGNCVNFSLTDLGHLGHCCYFLQYADQWDRHDGTGSTSPLKEHCLAQCLCTTAVSSDGTTRPRRSHGTVSCGTTEQSSSSEDLDLQCL